MRGIVLVAGFLVLGTPGHAAHPCDLSQTRGPVGLPQTIYVRGACGPLALRPDGRIEQAHPPAWAPSWARKAMARADERTYIVHPHRHLVLLRDGRTIWRSRLAHGSDNVAVHGDTLAFTAYVTPHPDLWVARLGQAEQLVTRGEDLDGWAGSGGFFTRRGRELRLRSSGGKLVRRIGRFAYSAYDRDTQSVVAITPTGQVIRTEGRTTVRLASLHAGRNPWVEVLRGGLIKIGFDNRLVLLEPDGTLFASTREKNIVSNLFTLPHRRGVVFVAQRGGVDRVLLLDRRARSAQLLYQHRTGPRGCGYWANLSLVGNNLLYWPSTGRALVAIDATNDSHPRDLWRLLRRIPGFRHGGLIRRAAWASAWNA
jgi:hypothetical protein